MTVNVLMIDNHDSFTSNIVEALQRMGATGRTCAMRLIRKPRSTRRWRPRR